MDRQILELIDQTLNLNGRGLLFTPETRLLGALPELDSLAVVALLSALESRFNIQFEDDEIRGSLFETVGSLTLFIKTRTGSPI